ncbi:glycosyltransferase [Dissulfurirhabdus thermomarina]|uniref:Glycosyltransferase n=1 Tax=Dissulfurirhabdus thermomarina TaxID=1765737 RepID=A0A6N9TMM5_DISTH|nr:glycosyltransferase [Dissulfurirhabdus thermomarina]NDY42541.1 glycosyltransferase [Dissulfurirhabdus thermomarina]NMX23537.1 glycosyltransferase [Dissulfurirhabdus thermomarina]
MAKRVLFLCRNFPVPAISGGKKVSLSTLQLLSEKYICDVVAFKDDLCAQKISAKDKEILGLANVCHIELARIRRLPSFLFPFYNIFCKSYYFFRDSYIDYIRRIYMLSSRYKYDIVFIDEIFGARVFLNKFLKRIFVEQQGAKILIQSHNIESVLVRRYANNMLKLGKFFLIGELFLIQLWEKKFWGFANKVIFISSNDYNIARKLCPKSSRFQFFFPSRLLHKRHRVSLLRRTNTILHIGTGHWPPNIVGLKYFLRHVLPLVRAKIKNVRFIHIGKGTPHSIKKYGDGDFIQVFDYIDEIDSYYENADVFVAPLLSGSGIKIKILDAMMRGLPVVTTPVGAEGIPDTAGVRVGATPQEFAQHIVSLIINDAERMMCGAMNYTCFDRIMDMYSTEAFYDILEDEYGA